MFSPFFAHAVTIGDIVEFTYLLINSLVPLLVGLAVLVFMWGVFTYVGAGDNEEKRSQGKNLMWFGIISIFVIISVWGLVNVLDATFNLDDTAEAGPELPSYRTVPVI